MRTMHFDSENLPEVDGLYEFQLELFDQAGNLLSNLTRFTFKVPQYAAAGFSENAPNLLLEDPTGNAATGGTADAFKMLMRFDTEKCDGDIFTIKVDDEPASLDCCGFVNYKTKPLDPVEESVELDLEITFEATHPNNFGVFKFSVVKGTCGVVLVANAAGMVIDDASGYVLDTVTGVYSKEFSPAQLLAECYGNGEGKAALGENCM